MNRVTKLVRHWIEKTLGSRSTATARPTVALVVESLEGREMPAP